ncbi:hypothetical protein AQUCO_00201066v1 [Aquilegia coerulea]|uniref:Uncharacterized protein n=1 Tax=Aquilegia coerulea TaxID=218851 RepID=A0A2G5F622_AQUCA|nr:hypothetical protein AQUCO_00201066v1 [Aquilegia coerulea]
MVEALFSSHSEGLDFWVCVKRQHAIKKAVDIKCHPQDLCRFFYLHSVNDVLQEPKKVLVTIYLLLLRHS